MLAYSMAGSALAINASNREVWYQYTDSFGELHVRPVVEVDTHWVCRDQKRFVCCVHPDSYDISPELQESHLVEDVWGFKRQCVLSIREGECERLGCKSHVMYKITLQFARNGTNIDGP